MKAKRTLTQGLIFLVVLATIPAFAAGPRRATDEVAVAIAADCGYGRSQAEEMLVQIDGVEDVWSPGSDKTLQVEYDPSQTSPEKIVAEFNSELDGFTIELADGEAAEDEPEQRPKRRSHKKCDRC